MKTYALYRDKDLELYYIVKRWNGSVKFIKSKGISRWHDSGYEFMWFFPIAMRKEWRKIKNLSKKDVFIEVL